MNNFREWISDNLRYIILVLCILAALIGIFFGVRALSGFAGRGSNSAASAGSDSSLSTGGSSPAPAAESVTSSYPAQTESFGTGGQLLEDYVPEITDLAKRYYEALTNNDTAAASECVDTMTDELKNEIENSTTSYSDIRTYTKTGLVPDSYVVFVYYHYLNEGDSLPLPGLSQMLVRKGDDGTYRIVFSDLDQATSDYIDSVCEEDDVKNLIQAVRDEYNTWAPADSDSGSASVSSSETVNEDQNTAESAAASPSEDTAGDTQQTGTEETAAEASADTPSGETTRVTTVISACFLRSEPAYSGQVLRTIPAGTEVTVIGDINNGWWHIRANDDGQEGYVGRGFIQ